MTGPHVLIAHLVGVLGLIVAPSLQAESPLETINLAAHHPGHAWLQPYDPTLMSRRLLTQFEYENDADGGSSEKWLWNVRGAISVNKNLAFSAQLEVPWRWVDTATGDDAGWGDLETRLGFAGHLSHTSRWGLGLNATFPTATDLLGDGVFELRPMAGIRWELARRLQVGTNLEYSFTPRDEGTSDVSALEIKIPVTVKLSEKFSAFTSYNPRWNLAGNSDRHRMEFGLTRLLGPRNEYALSLGAEIPLTDETFGWKGSLGFTWFF